jgi:hypothetical protein
MQETIGGVVGEYLSAIYKGLKLLVRPERLELPTLCSEGRCSIHLSYGRARCILSKLGRKRTI